MALSSKTIRNPYLWAYTAAVLLHLLLMVLEKPLSEALFVAPVPEVPVFRPLQFEFVDVHKTEDRIENSPNTPLVSEHNQISHDQQNESLPEGHLATLDGASMAKEVSDAMRSESQTFDNAEAKREDESVVNEVDPDFSFADVLKKRAETAQRDRELAVLGSVTLSQPKVKLDNRLTRALERGGLQLSTYAWNFAPYLKYLKRHIGDHIFPPPAFDIGAIEGTTRVKFRIWRDGRLEGPELIDFKGHSLLKDTSIKAVELSAPFKALPSDFPDQYLEIVGRFEYVILRSFKGRP